MRLTVKRNVGLLQICAVLFLTAFVPSMVHAADVVVPRFELLTRGYPADGSLFLSTRADVDIAVEGGYKFGGGLGFSIEDPALEDRESAPPATPQEVERTLDRYLALEYAEATIKSIADGPLNLTYFIGATETFGSGEDFPDLFGTAPFSSHYRGPLYAYGGTIYRGLYEVSGTGLGISTTPINDFAAFSVHTYQDLRFEPGVYSSDARAAFNTRRLKAEVSAGATYPAAEGGLYRGAVMAFFDTGTAGELFAQAALPRWDPWSGDPLTLDDFYFLFEPRVRLDIFSAILTLFWRPSYYDHLPTGEDGALDANLRFQLGDYEQTRVRGGIETGLHYRPESDQQIDVDTSPFISVTTGGVVWDFLVRTTVYPYEYEDSFEGYLGIRTAF